LAYVQYMADLLGSQKRGAGQDKVAWPGSGRGGSLQCRLQRCHRCASRTQKPSPHTGELVGARRHPPAPMVQLMSSTLPTGADRLLSVIFPARGFSASLANQALQEIVGSVS
jgi:hypothetical protein